MEEKIIAARAVTVKAASSGAFSALFSTEDEDLEGDIILSTAFDQGASAPLLWAHDPARIIGKGTVRRVPRGAALDGRFFTETIEGADKFKTVKAMGPTQKWSFAFAASDWERRAGGGRLVRKLKLYEVSPVSVPANPYTQTLSISEKSAGPTHALFEVLNPAVAVPDRLRRAADRAAEEAQTALGLPYWLMPRWVAEAAPGSAPGSSLSDRWALYGPTKALAWHARDFPGSLFLKLSTALSVRDVKFLVCHEAAHSYQYHHNLRPDEDQANAFANDMLQDWDREDSDA